MQTEESKRKISEKNKGRRLTSYQRKQIIKSNRTRVYGAETLKKLSKINKGRKFPKEFGEKISKSRLGIKLSKKHKINIGQGVKGEKNGMFGKTHSLTARKKISLSRLGRIPWNKGKKYQTGNVPWNKGIEWKRKINRKEVNSYV